jgi:FMN phosphatase YigB (HAD superfamily)
MPLSLEQFVKSYDSRDLVWPAPPQVEPPKAKPHLKRLPGIRVVLWNVYGTLLNIFGGQLLFEHPEKFVMDIALDKIVQEFKMWGSMSRKPGQPSEYMGEIYHRVLTDQRLAPSPGEKYPELHAERIWEAIVKKLYQKDYKYDLAMYGTLAEFSQKLAYFFHASLQGTACYEGVGAALERMQHLGVRYGLLADAQCFTFVQLQRGIASQKCAVPADALLDKSLRFLSCEVGGRKPSDRLFKRCLTQLAAIGVTPGQVLHVGSRMKEDIVAARKLGMRTALFAGDKNSVQATKEQVRDNETRPDVLITDFSQFADVVGP